MRSNNTVKGSMSRTGILFLVTFLIVILIMGLAFGKGIVFTGLTSLGKTSPTYLQEEVATMIMTISSFDGDGKFGLPVKADHTITVTANEVSVAAANTAMFKTPLTPQKFATPGGITISPLAATKLSPLSLQTIYVNKVGNKIFITVEKTGGKAG